MGEVTDHYFDSKCPHCKKKVKTHVQTKGSFDNFSISWAGVEKV